ncbi:galactokinase [Pontibacter akesuensis]|uniref:Galactokinase n=1 Tax=Pontibacter akesuensis TaxID=388950 RepID=A0A1I7JCL9_9BACT|nr:galactokinase [Pontibacter akesuensis]GHA70927.1 galactokinase [Pontibacter akesuensis]SFU82930.1 galactokinase [Pontibacter akesuensis]
MKTLEETIHQKFKSMFQAEPILVRSPGRVNLIGEHTDYNEGFVLPAAINKEIYFAIAFNNSDRLRFHSHDMEENAEFELNAISKTNIGWANYLLGVVKQFQQANLQVKGFDLVFGGNIPIGAGLSSSAAVECGLAFALDHLHGFGLERLTMVKMAQKAEHEFAGVLCGIMDQFASMFGRQQHAVKLDCRSLAYEYFPVDMHDYRIVLCDTQVKHSLASSEYNTRRKECETGVALLQQHYPEVQSLRDTTVAMLEQHQAEFDTVVYKRCKYIVLENARVEEACRHLQRGEMQAFGQNMYASHAGLQHDYEVSCPELDFLVAEAKKQEGVLGARMMGGGFGGCTINLVRLQEIDAFIAQQQQAYQRQFGVNLKTYLAEIVDGSSLVAQPETKKA